MNHLKTFAFAIVLLIGIASCNVQKKSVKTDAEIIQLNTATDSLSYSLGLSIGRSLQSQNFDTLSYAHFNKAIQDVMNGQNMLMDNATAQQIIRDYVMQQKDKEKITNKAEGDAFLAKNKLRAVVVQLESGLQYEILKKGTGAKPTLTDKVTTHYHGTLIDGTVFDSSVERGTPIQFNVQGVIPGWTEALQLMEVGSKWRLFIPPHLAYGERGSGPKIGANATLIFDVELISIEQE